MKELFVEAHKMYLKQCLTASRLLKMYPITYPRHKTWYLQINFVTTSNRIIFDMKNPGKNSEKFDIPYLNIYNNIILSIDI